MLYKSYQQIRADLDEQRITVAQIVNHHLEKIEEHNPNLNAYSGGSVAAPVFSKIAEDTLNYLGYTSDE